MLVVTTLNIATTFELIGRIVLAALCGILIGYERKNKSKVAGVRTHCIVACASALMMILSKYAYFDLISSGNELLKLDPSRVASAVVSGIGFLGAGMIFVHHNTVSGLTTAAGIWATSGIGMALGSGLYIIGLSATIILFLLQIILHKIPFLQPDAIPEVDIDNKQPSDNLRFLVQETQRLIQAQAKDGQQLYSITINPVISEDDNAPDADETDESVIISE